MTAAQQQHDQADSQEDEHREKKVLFTILPEAISRQSSCQLLSEGLHSAEHDKKVRFGGSESTEVKSEVPHKDEVGFYHHDVEHGPSPLLHPHQPGVVKVTKIDLERDASRLSAELVDDSSQLNIPTLPVGKDSLVLHHERLSLGSTHWGSASSLVASTQRGSTSSLLQGGAAEDMEEQRVQTLEKYLQSGLPDASKPYHQEVHRPHNMPYHREVHGPHKHRLSRSSIDDHSADHGAQITAQLIHSKQKRGSGERRRSSLQYDSAAVLDYVNSQVSAAQKAFHDRVVGQKKRSTLRLKDSIFINKERLAQRRDAYAPEGGRRHSDDSRVRGQGTHVSDLKRKAHVHHQFDSPTRIVKFI